MLICNIIAEIAVAFDQDSLRRASAETLIRHSVAYLQPTGVHLAVCIAHDSVFSGLP